MTALLLAAAFLAAVGAMVSRRAPAMLVLPALAMTVGAIAGAPHVAAAAPAGLSGLGWLAHVVAGTVALVADEVVAGGVPRLAGAAFTVMLGGVFGRLLEITGVAPALVRRVAELAGDRVFELTLALTLTVALLFTSLGGLGAVVMVGGILFPVLLSLGLPPPVAGATFLMGFSFGGLFNLVNWKLYTEVLGLPTAVVATFAARLGVVYFGVLIAFLAAQLRRARLPVPSTSLAKAGLVWAALAALMLGGAGSRVGAGVGRALGPVLAVGLVAAACLPRRSRGEDGVALLAPLVPLVAVLFLGAKIEAGFVAGILFGLARARGDRGQLMARAMVEGIQGVAPAIALMMGIGMLLKAFWHPGVVAVVRPALTALVPAGGVGFVVFFALAAPLALYRGPLNVWGMGFGIAQILAESGALSPARVMVAFLSDGQLQGVSDPTNTHNVWVAGQLKVDTQELLVITLPWVWGLAVCGLVLGAAGL